ncbi:MAG: hypothetical protein R6V56_07425 [Lentisphaeria bacterium]
MGHENCVLHRLAGIEGVPESFGKVDACTLSMEYIDAAEDIGESADPDQNHEPPPVSFFESLKRLMAEVHERGITHCDIRRRNILRDAYDHPYVIDFATAVCKTGLGNLAGNPLFCLAKRLDDHTILKLQNSFRPNSLTTEEKEWLNWQPFYLKVGKFVRRRIYKKWIKPRAWRERLTRLRERMH